MRLRSSLVFSGWYSRRSVCLGAEILILGCGPRITRDLPADIKEFLKINGIVVEYLDSVRQALLVHGDPSVADCCLLQINACSTFNILNAEDRKVAAAILPIDIDAVNAP